MKALEPLPTTLKKKKWAFRGMDNAESKGPGTVEENQSSALREAWVRKNHKEEFEGKRL